ncbi:hypothetical protein OC844_004677 [Tilletia horrida]|nr:hypothetical protein OC844_004677 [Tilletia horrida]
MTSTLTSSTSSSSALKTSRTSSTTTPRKGPPPGTGKSGPPSWTLQEHIDHLTALLSASPSAEELQSTWNGHATKTGDERTPLALGLKDYKAALDSGRRISPGSGSKNDAGERGKQRTHVGLPLWIVVRTLKASWHADGSWPLAGSDATEADATLTLPAVPPPALPASANKQQKRGAIPASASVSQATVAATTVSTTFMRLPRSVHPAALLLKPRVPSPNALPPPEPGPPVRPDPTPDQIAQAYRARGIQVPDPPTVSPSDDEDSDDERGGRDASAAQLPLFGTAEVDDDPSL